MSSHWPRCSVRRNPSLERTVEQMPGRADRGLALAVLHSAGLLTDEQSAVSSTSSASGSSDQWPSLSDTGSEHLGRPGSSRIHTASRRPFQLVRVLPGVQSLNDPTTDTALAELVGKRTTRFAASFAQILMLM
jgi:hypothetical protein